MKHFYLFISLMVMAASVAFGQNNFPVAVGEFVLPVFGSENPFQDTTISINVLLNDSDPDGDPIELFDVKGRVGQSGIQIYFTDSVIYLTMAKSNIIEQGYEYRVAEVDDTTSLSNWATLIVNPCIHPDNAVARNDTVDGVLGYNVYVDVLANDTYGANDTVMFSQGSFINGKAVYTCPDFSNEDHVSVTYLVADKTNPNQFIDIGLIYIKIINSEYFSNLDVNNVDARFSCFGNHFWDMDGLQYYFVPKGTPQTSVFSNSLWIGGLDENDELHLAGERYRADGPDYWHGPVSDVYDSLYDLCWYHVWKLSQTDIDYHKAHWMDAGYEPIEDILTWPGNGDVNLGQTEQIAPYEDNNGNGIYEPMQGDAPIIKGDQALFFVFNDAREEHLETGGTPLGLEFHGMAYAFDMPEDSALWSTVFLSYKMINRSGNAYHDTYVGSFTDTDLGYAWNDYNGCDVQRGMHFTYNGTPEDLGGPEAYGENPPALGVLFLGGPFMEEDDMDNPKFDGSGNQLCNESINGLNFGDSIIDNERFGLTGFMQFNNGGAFWQTDPVTAPEYYQFMNSIWSDDVPLQYGGGGHPSAGSVGPECRFMYPGDSDLCNWGTNGIPPNGGYNEPGLYWTEEQEGNSPADRRGLGSSGPFTFEDGDIQYLDLAFVWARAYDGNPWSSVELLKERASYIKDMFENNETFFSGVLENEKTGLRLWPNPAKNTIRLELPSKVNQAEYAIYNMQGQPLLSGKVHATKEIETDVSALQKGLYIYRVNTGSSVFVNKFMKQ